MQYPERFVLAGSERNLPDGHTSAGPVDPDERASVTVYLRPRNGLDDSVRLSRQEFTDRFGAAPEDIDVVNRFAAEFDLSVDGVDPARRSITVSGRLEDLGRAFGAALEVHADRAGARHRGRTGLLLLPLTLEGVVTGVFGLDERAQAAARLRIAAATPATQYTAVQVAAQYSFPTGVTGRGECVAIVELGGGFQPADLDTYFSALSLATPSVVAVSVDGGTNTPGSSDGPDAEVMLDIEVSGAVAPGASIAVYFAPNTDQGFLDAITTAVHDATNHPSVISISWGGAESTWTAQAMTEMEAAFTAAAILGVTVITACGDNGSTDGVTDGLQHVDFPSSAPHALSCGGTTLTSSSEVVWNSLSSGGGATGGGISDQFDLPAYQAGAGVPASANPGAHVGRGVPDVAGDADPDTGYAIQVDGQSLVVGGTSAVAPLWAGLIALCNQALGSPLGFVQAQLYATSGSFHDITSGSNGAYVAGPGWDACTGLGRPDGAALLAVLRGPAPAP